MAIPQPQTGRSSHPVVTGSVTHSSGDGGARHLTRTAVAEHLFVVIASRVVSPDRLAIELRGEHETRDGAERHAHLLARVVADRFGVPACADVLTIDGLPVCSVARFPHLEGGAA